jgi:hypothetical protein
LEKIQLKPEDSFEINRLNHRDFAREQIEVVSREYDEDFYREPVGSERACVMGAKCIATTIRCDGKPVILREWFLPSCMEDIKKNNSWPPDISECIVCMLCNTAKFYYNTKASHFGVRADCQVPLFMHRVGVKGEYRIEDCIGSTEKKFLGFWGPVVRFNMTNLEYTLFDVPIDGDRDNVKTARGFKLTLPYPDENNTIHFG